MMGHRSDLVIWPILILLPLNLQTRKKWSLYNSKVTHGIFHESVESFKDRREKESISPLFPDRKIWG